MSCLKCLPLLSNRCQTPVVKCRLVVPVITLLVLAVTACSDKIATSGSTAEQTTTTGELAGVITFNDLTQNHVTTPVSYPQSPPVGGDHSPIWQNCGIYDGTVANENAVHSMEHGAVWLAYRPDLGAADVEILRFLARGHTHVLVAPYTGLSEAVVATAWGKQLRLSSVDAETLKAFVQTYEQGPQTPELGVTCSGELGNPIE